MDYEQVLNYLRDADRLEYVYGTRHNAFHNLDHIKSFDMSTCPSDAAEIAAYYHDAFYDPQSTTNEETAAKYIREISDGLTDESGDVINLLTRVQELIMSTKYSDSDFENMDDPEIRWLHGEDLNYFTANARMDITLGEILIFSEYQFIPIKEYKEKRIEILERFKAHPLTCSKRIDKIIDFIKNMRPAIGVMCGSFNPVHAGHLYTLSKVRDHFPKIIVAQGHNRAKSIPEPMNHPALKYHETLTYNTSIFDFLNGLFEDYSNVTLIRGIRNNDDLENERVMMELVTKYTKCSVMHVLSPTKYQNISSSLIRELNSLNISTEEYLWP